MRQPRRLIAFGPMIVTVACTGCGSAVHLGRTNGAVHTSSALTRLIAARRPIGAGRRFHPPVRGPMPGACRRRLGPRQEAHIELFADNKVVLLPAGIGIRHRRIGPSGRVEDVRCYGSLATLDPTGVVYMRPGAMHTLANLFRAWGQPLSQARLAAFTAVPGARVATFVDGHRWTGPPGTVPLTDHAEIVLEVGPHVPPHHSYTFPPGPP